ncbi:hypothetical protein UY3_01940 [Chelonia mydas]|uniref:BED-type domain-containing protein n=1 Tax=Chelonia mydas TaxID=8469 RepID=M7BUF8_CHEMY|nr:hypothetical protein UY3_01940 [Chelonia mydas]
MASGSCDQPNLQTLKKGKPIVAADRKRDPGWEYVNEVPLPVGKRGMHAKCKQCNKEMEQSLVAQMKQHHEKCSFSGGSCVEDDERNMSEHAGSSGTVLDSLGPTAERQSPRPAAPAEAKAQGLQPQALGLKLRLQPQVVDVRLAGAQGRKLKPESCHMGLKPKPEQLSFVEPPAIALLITP